jgi:probable phosphoglycerate mutase
MVKRSLQGPPSWFVLAIALTTLGLGAPTHADERAASNLQIWFMRHAESELNVPTLAHPVADAGVSYPLTKRGMEQARAFAKAHKDVPVLAIYTSTRLRAIQTADALAFEHGLAVTLAPEAAEIDLGIAPDAPNFSALYHGLKAQWLTEGNFEARQEGGESLGDVQRRFLPFVREIMNRHAHDRGVVVIMSHGATLGFLVPMLVNNVPDDFGLMHPLTNTGVIKTVLKDNSLLCIDWVGVKPEQLDTAQ